MERPDRSRLLEPLADANRQRQRNQRRLDSARGPDISPWDRRLLPVPGSSPSAWSWVPGLYPCPPRHRRQPGRPRERHHPLTTSPEHTSYALRSTATSRPGASRTSHTTAAGPSPPRLPTRTTDARNAARQETPTHRGVTLRPDDASPSGVATERTFTTERRGPVQTLQSSAQATSETDSKTVVPRPARPYQDRRGSALGPAARDDQTPR
jgi:hypothetical protein